jgi:hypothetical protein
MEATVKDMKHLSEYVVKQYNFLYPDSERAMRRAIRNWITIREDSLNELNCFFSENELTLLISLANYDVELESTSTEQHDVEDDLGTYIKCLSIHHPAEEKCHQLEESLGVSLRDLEKKTERLTSAQSYVVLDWIYNYWRNSSYYNKPISEYIQRMVTKIEDPITELRSELNMLILESENSPSEELDEQIRVKTEQLCQVLLKDLNNKGWFPNGIGGS